MQQNAIVTGAASGIGLACARRLVERGWRVAAIDVQDAVLAKNFADVTDRVSTIAADLGQSDACRSSVATAVQHLGHVDALLHFAAAWTGSSWDMSDAAEWDRILSVNLRGTFLVTQAVAHHMVARGKGAMVLTGSDSAKVGGVAGGPAYASSKGGVIALTHSLAKALGPKGIRVNAVNPGVIDTAMTQGWPASLKDDYTARMPLGRLGQPEDVADVACFLASDEARFVTGEVVEVNGGAYFD